MINVYNLFAVPMTHGTVPVPINIHKKIIKFVEDNYKSEDNISCVKGFQYHNNFDGKKELNNFIDTYLKNVHHLEIASAWINVLDNESYNTPHSHAGNQVTHAGVLYLSNNNNNINFARDNETFQIKPKLFDYLIFPYNLLHYVLPEKRLEKRVCYAFNLRRI
tara:strand:+ start:599 stop:1087 length:489 start_codon:yes stop_codon:yes gene_type:complete